VIKQASLSIAVATTLFMTGCGGELNKMAEKTALEAKEAALNSAIHNITEETLKKVGEFTDSEAKGLITDETARAEVVVAIQDNLRPAIKDRVSHAVKGSEDLQKVDFVKTAIEILEILKPEIIEMIKAHLPQEEPEPEPEPTIEEVQETVLPAEAVEAINSVSTSANAMPSVNVHAKNALNHLGHFLKENTGYKVTIKAFTDASGSNAYNLELSQKRANFLAEYLTSIGVSETQVEAKGFGEEELLDPSNPNSSKNRRIVVELSEISE
jgi:outer membrane protein OmpA-like peptidoglycan-associated protein